jgi:hypothetical protein
MAATCSPLLQARLQQLNRRVQQYLWRQQSQQQQHQKQQQQLVAAAEVEWPGVQPAQVLCSHSRCTPYDKSLA